MRKKERNPKLLTAQEFVNVEEIADDLIYSNDGYVFGFLYIRAGDNKLMSEREQEAYIEQLTSAMAQEKEPWQLLSVPRTSDTLGMIAHLAELRKKTDEDAKLKLINGEISEIQKITREGTKEPMIVLKCWTRASRGADRELKKRLSEIRSRLSENRVSAEPMRDRDITYLCKVFADLTVYQQLEDADFSDDLPVIAGETRRLSVKREKEDVLKSLITPVGGLSFGVSRVTVGSVTGRIYGAVRYPSELNRDWAVELTNSSDCVTSVTFYPGNSSELGDALSRSIRRNSSDAASENNARRRMRLEKQAEDAGKMIGEMDFKNAAIGHMSLLVMPFTDNEENLEEICRGVSGRYARKNIKLKTLGGLQKQAYKHVSPYYPNQPEIDDVTRHIMPLRTLIGGSPMTVNIYRDDNGCFFGNTMDGGIISLDFQYRGRDRTNGNIVAMGTSGSGKSTTLKHIIQSLYMCGVKILIIDPEREFRDLCKNLGGAWFDAGGGGAKINPLQIRPAPEDDEDTNGENMLYQADDNAMAAQIRTLDVFFKLYLPGLTNFQRALVKQSLVELYGSRGITWNTDFSKLGPESYPVLSDLHALMLKKSETEADYRELAAMFYDMAEGADSFLWNGQTNIDIDSGFVCFDTNRLQNGSDEVKRTQYFNLLTMCWERMSRDRDEPVFLLCDEGYIMLDPNMPQAAMFLRNMVKRGRKYGAQLGVVAQSAVDFLHESIRLYGQAILDNSAYKLMFRTDGKNLKETSELFDLTEAEENALLSGQRGKALCFIGGQHLQVEFKIPEYKLELMGRGGGN